MRKLALSVLLVSSVAGAFVGCGGSSPRKVNTGTAGHGAAGSTGAAGVGAAGSTGSAGAAAGDNGTAGAGNTAGSAAGAAGGSTGAAGSTAGSGGDAAGSTGAAGQAPPPPTCATMAKTALPVVVSTSYPTQILLNGGASSTAMKIVTAPDCNATTFPAFPVLIDAGTTDAGDAGSEAGTDSGSTSDGGVADSGSDTGSTSDGSVDVHADAPATDVHADAPADVAQTDASTTGGSCYEFSYDPDACVVANNGSTNNCWDGVIFAQTSTIGVDTAGICIADGAKHITFEARASKPLMVKFGGGNNTGGDGSGTSEYVKSITTSWATYSLDSPTALGNYNANYGVWDGFSVVGLPDQGAGGVYILIRNMQWVAQ